MRRFRVGQGSAVRYGPKGVDTAGTINLTQTATWSAALCQYLSLTVLRYVFKRRSMFVMKVLYMWSSIRQEIAARDL